MNSAALMLSSNLNDGTNTGAFTLNSVSICGGGPLLQGRVELVVVWFPTLSKSWMSKPSDVSIPLCWLASLPDAVLQADEFDLKKMFHGDFMMLPFWVVKPVPFPCPNPNMCVPFQFSGSTECVPFWCAGSSSSSVNPVSDLWLKYVSALPWLSPSSLPPLSSGVMVSESVTAQSCSGGLLGCCRANIRELYSSEASSTNCSSFL